MLWIGKKLFKLREKVSVSRGLAMEDEEKPFLDHLEDLRKTLMKIIVTLIVTMVAAFAFNKEITEIVKGPVYKAEIDRPEKEDLPHGFKDAAEWPELISIAHGLDGLDAAQREIYLSHAFKNYGEHLRPYLDPLLAVHAALDLPKEARPAYLDEALKGNDEGRKIAQDMVDKKLDVGFEHGPAKMRMWFSKPGEGFNLSMKFALYAGIIGGFPFLLYFLLEFVVPGLTKQERRVLWPSLGVGFGLFLVGVVFSYIVVTPNALRFFYNYDRQEMGGVSDYRMSDYASFVIQFTLIFGLAFELPVVVYALNKLGILSYELMKRTRSYAIVIIVIIAAVITPTSDLINLSLLAVPMLVLYEISIWIAYFNDKRVKANQASQEAEYNEWLAKKRPSTADTYLAPATDEGTAAPDHDHHDHDGHEHHDGSYPDPHHAHDEPNQHEAHESHLTGDVPHVGDATSTTPDFDHGSEVPAPEASQEPPFAPDGVEAPAADNPPTEPTPPPSSTPGEPSGESSRRPDYP